MFTLQIHPLLLLSHSCLTQGASQLYLFHRTAIRYYLAFRADIASMDEQAIIQEINETRAFLVARGKSVTPALHKSLASQIILQIGHMGSMSTKCAASIAKALEESPYGDETASVHAALDDALMSSAVHAGKLADSGKLTGQKLIAFENYATQKDWDIFRSPKLTMAMKMERAIYRLNKYGCGYLHEQTQKHVLAILLCCHHTELPDYHDIFQELQNLKKVAEANRKQYVGKRTMKYPTSPFDLPQAMQDSAIDLDDPPVKVELVGLKTIANKHIPLRSNSKLLKKKKADKLDDDAAFTWSDLKALLKGSEAPGLHIFGPKGKRSLTGMSVGLRSMDAEELNDIETEVKRVRKHLAMTGQGKSADSLQLASPSSPVDVPANPKPDQAAHVPGLQGRDYGDGHLKPGSIPDGLAKKKATEQAAPDADPPMNDYEEAAYTALTKRNAKKAEDAKMRKALMKRPACAKPEHKKVPATGGTITATPEKPAKAFSYPVVSKKSPCPKQGASPCDYKGGRIYTNSAKHGFRTIRDRTNRFSERFVTWGGKRPTLSSWKVALQAIDEYRKD